MESHWKCWEGGEGGGEGVSQKPNFKGKYEAKLRFGEGLGEGGGGGGGEVQTIKPVGLQLYVHFLGSCCLLGLEKYADPIFLLVNQRWQRY